MYKFILYSRKSKNAQDGHKQHTHATAEWQINNYLRELDNSGIHYEIIGSFEEDISGGGYYTRRPIFSSIVKRCKMDKSLTLLVAKADRMCRNLRTGTELMETINFVLANAPDADDLQKHLEFMIAEREYKMISQRFKDMYAAKKHRCEEKGEDLNWGAGSLKYQANKAAGLHKVSTTRKTVPSAQKQFAADKVKEIITINSSLTLDKIGDLLNNMGHTTPTGKQFTKTSVSKLIKDFGIERKRLNKHITGNV